MEQPKWDTPIEDLREFLQFAVPLRAATLAQDLRGYSPDETRRLLIGQVRSGGTALGSYGDALQFSDGRPRTGKRRDRVIRTTDDLVGGIAAAALLAQLDGLGGVWVFGDYYGTGSPECHPLAPVLDLPLSGPEAA